MKRGCRPKALPAAVQSDCDRIKNGSKRVSSNFACPSMNSAGIACVVQSANRRPSVPPATERRIVSVSS